MKFYQRLLLISLIAQFCVCSFEVKLLKYLAGHKDNVVISPFSIWEAFMLVVNGAVGSTEQEILDFLEMDTADSANHRNLKILDILSKSENIHIANAVMSRFTPKDTFVSIAKQFGAKADKLISADQVNSWCAKKTQGKITHILDKIDNIQMILLNAIYFKGSWKQKFDKANTRFETFYGKTAENQVEMMSATVKTAKYYEKVNVQIIKLPYQDADLHAIIILPYDMESYMAELTQEKLRNDINAVFPAEVDLKLPKFELKYEASLVPGLNDLGMNTPMSHNADFSNITSKMNLFIDDVIHKTYLKVDEEGTEAAAVTVITIKARAAIRPMKKKMIVNRPFLFAIEHERIKDNLLFLGRIDQI